jgi:hypothetical protein
MLAQDFIILLLMTTSSSMYPRVLFSGIPKINSISVSWHHAHPHRAGIVGGMVVKQEEAGL